MSAAPFNFVPLPAARSKQKPRRSGLTMIVDDGLPLAWARDIVALAGNYIDLAKIKTGTARLYPREQLVAKLRLYRRNRIQPFLGGQFHEYIYATQGAAALPRYYAEALELGFKAIEISDNVVPLTDDQRRAQIRAAARAGLIVYGEVGSKELRSDPRTLVRQAEACFEAGAALVLIEAAEFDPLSIRTTARTLTLQSDSSYRFERRVDPEGVEWASRRCCQLIVELAGGRIASGVIDVAAPRPRREPIVLRLAQLRRILGIDVPADEARRILVALGCEACAPSEGCAASEPSAAPKPAATVRRAPDEPARAAPPRGAVRASGATDGGDAIRVVAPSWRRDLTREIDLVEEVGRVWGYDRIPEDVGVPMVPSAPTRHDRVLAKVRHVMTAAGFDEAMTLSLVDQRLSGFSPWTSAEPLRTLTPILRGADRLRRSLIPSLLAARQANEALSNPVIELFEIAKVYLPRPSGLPEEVWMLGMVSARDEAVVRGWLARTPAEVEARLLEQAEWFDCLLRVQGSSVSVSINGQKTVEIAVGSLACDGEALAGKAGRLAFQMHGGAGCRLEVASVEVREFLPSSGAYSLAHGEPMSRAD